MFLEKRDQCCSCQYDKLIARTAGEFVTTPVAGMDKAIDCALQLCGEFFSADRSYIFQFNPRNEEGETMDNTYEWCREGIESQKDTIRDFPAGGVPWFMAKISSGDYVHLPHLDALPPEAEGEKREFQRQGIKSLLCVPLVDEGQVMGFLGFDYVRAAREWPLEQVKQVSYIARLFSSALARQQAELDLRESEARLRHITDNMTDVVWTTDLDFKATFISPSCERLYGIPVEKYLKRTPRERFPVSSLLKIHQAKMEELEKEKDPGADKDRTIMIELEQYKSDGSIINVVMHNRLIRDKKGKVIGFQGVTRDITRQKRDQEALRKSEERFQKMLSLVPDTVSIHDPDMNIIYSNWNGFAAVPEAKRLLNTKCFKTYRGYDHICPDCKAIKVMATKEAFQEEVELPDGRWVDLRVIPLLDQDNEVELFVEWVRDITGRKRAEETIKQQNNLLEGIINGVTDVLAIQEPDCTIERYNQAGYQMLGLNPGQVWNKKCYQLIGREAACEPCASKRALETKKTAQIEKYIPELGLHLDCKSNPVLDEEGNVIQIVMQLKDITGRKEREQQLADYTQELELLYRQLDQELDKAWQIHQRTLPKTLPVVEDISLAAHYQPAQKLGGDFYNVIRVGRRLVIYLSDVSGHGLDGAMLTIFLKGAIDSYLALQEREITPGKLLRHLCRQYHRENYTDDYFICILLAVLDLDTRELACTGAGFQDFPLVKGGDGGLIELACPGLPISGAFPPGLLGIQEKRITLAPGTTILFNTDGLTEQWAGRKTGGTGEVNPQAGGLSPGGTGQEIYGSRLKEVFNQNSHRPPEEIVQAINQDFRAFNNGSLQGDDDITYVILQVQ